PPADRQDAPAARAARPPRPPDLWRRPLRLGAHFRPGHRPARPRPDVPAPGPLRAGHADRPRAAPPARPLRLPPPRSPAMSDATRDAGRTIIQEDVNNRGLQTDPHENLVTACPQDFAAACGSLAGAEHPAVAIVTGFYIPHGQPPCGETDG